MANKTVVLGMLGSTLDQGVSAQRWERWRPTVALGQHDDLRIDRMEILYGKYHEGIADVVVEDLHLVSPETEVVRRLFELNNPWDFEEVYAALFDFAKAYPFDPEHEDYLVHITTGTHVAQICWFLLTEANYFPARLIQTSPGSATTGAQGNYSIIDLDLSRYNRIAQRFRREQADTVQLLKSGIQTRNTQFNRMIEQIERVASRSQAPMLLTGPTGAGKSFLAQRIFELKKQRQRLKGAFIEVNCATLRGDAAMSTLFGHVRGAFTGAQTQRAGLLRMADGGMLFLDEIGELGLDEQAMLLKAIEEKRFAPFGSDQEVSSNFQLIAGTNRNLSERIQAGRFREDLFTRINLWTFALPGLAERPEDIEPNLDYELERYASHCNMHIRFNTEARQRYLAFAASKQAHWPGNFRELTASMTRLATLAEGGRITVEQVDEEIALLSSLWRNANHRQSDNHTDCIRTLLGEQAETLDLFDHDQLKTVIRVCRQSKNLSDAGRTLFSHSRQKKKQPNDADRLRKYLSRFHLDWDSVRQ